MRTITGGLLAAILFTACVDDPVDLGTSEDEVLTRDHRDPSVGGSQHRLPTTPIFELPIQLTAGQRVVFETRNPSAGGDPVLHLLAPVAGNGAVTEVARDDDSAGDYNARLSYTPPTSGTYVLIMRAAWKNKGGTAEILKNGRPIWTPLPFGGGFQRLENLRVNEELTTVPLPGAPVAHTMYLLGDDGGMLERHVSAGNQSATRRLTSPRAVAIAMVGPSWTDTGGPIRLVRNDVRLSGHDPDGDGLGTELEAHLGTCSTSTDLAGEYECSRAMDLRDTDGDGLDDKLELLGKVGSAPYQLLPRWGADPRHKDLFLEVDFYQATPSEPDQLLAATVARGIATAYGDPETSPLFRLANAQTLRNPDLQPGIRLHFDTGQHPPAGASEEDLTLYGNWGGHNVVAPVCSGTDCERASASALWRQQMHGNRHGVFHYIGGYPGGGGQAPPHSVANMMPMSSAGVAAHELGHSLGLGHNGPYDGEPTDANCKPTYPSLMSYAYLDQGWRRFSDGYGRASINNTALRELAAVSSPSGGPGALYLQHLRDFFDYDVDLVNGHVDWNRDGVFSAGTVRAYANNNGAGCEFTKYNQVTLSSATTRAPALARLGNATIMLSIDAGRRLAFEYTVSDLTCPTPTPQGCGSAPVRHEVSDVWSTGLEALDAHRVVENGEPKLLLVYRKADALYEVTFSRVTWSFGTPRLIETIVPAIDELSLTGDDTTVYLAYKGAGGRPMLKVRNAGTWAEDELVRDGNGDLLGPLGEGSSPALLEAGPAGARTLYAVFPGSAGALRLYTFDRTTRRFIRSPWTMSEETSIGKPALGWMPLPAGSGLPGRLYLMSIRRRTDERSIVRERMLVARRTGTGALQLSMALEGDHQNSWLYGYGLDLLFEPGVDSNLRLLLARKRLDDNDQPLVSPLELRPKADGIVDYDLRNWNDWEVLRVDLCRTLVSAGGTGLRCPAWSW